MSIPSVNSVALSPSGGPLAATVSTTTAAPAQPAQPVQPAATAKPSNEQLQDVVKAANDFIKPYNDSVQFSIDKDTGETVVKVIDKNTQEIIKQMPSEDMLAMAKALDQLKGLLVKQKA